MADEALHIFVEPPIPVTSEFCDVEHVRAVIRQLDLGLFRMPALLLERMFWNPRFRAVVDTRMAGLIATQVEFLPSVNNRDGRRAARELREDWPLMMSSPMRKQMLIAAIFLGLGLAQRVPDESPSSGRTIFKMRPYWTGFASWYWARKAYRIITFDKGVTESPSPAVDRAPIEAFAPSIVDGAIPSAREQPWVLAEPYGMNTWRNALLHAAWRPWLGHDWAMRDQARASEKHGIGIMQADYPRGEGEQHKKAITKFTDGLRGMGTEGIVPCEQRGQGEPGFGIKAFEFNGTGFQAISDTMNSNAVALAILLLGHNLTTEIKGGGSYAAAGVADYIRDDKKYEDGSTEDDYARPQIVVPWAEANYGDPGLAPLIRYVTDSPAVNKARAEMINQVGQAAAQLRANVPRVDLEALAEEFRLPLLAQQVRVQVPPAPTPAKSDQEAA